MGPPPGELARRGRTFSRRGILDLGGKALGASALGALATACADTRPSSAPTVTPVSTVEKPPEASKLTVELPSAVGLREDIRQKVINAYVLSPNPLGLGPSFTGVLDHVKLPIKIVGSPKPTTAKLESFPGPKSPERRTIAEEPIDPQTVQKNGLWTSLFSGKGIALNAGVIYGLSVSNPAAPGENYYAMGINSNSIVPWEKFGVVTVMNFDLTREIAAIADAPLSQRYPGEYYSLDYPGGWDERSLIFDSPDISNIKPYAGPGRMFVGDKINGIDTFLGIGFEQLSPEISLAGYQANIRAKILNGKTSDWKPTEPRPIKAGTEPGLFTRFDHPNKSILSVVTKKGNRGFRLDFYAPSPLEKEQEARFLTKILPTFKPLPG